MHPIVQLIADAREEYESYLSAGGARFLIPSSYTPSGPNTVRPSSLDGCPLAHAYDKLGILPDFPDLKSNPDKNHLMSGGNYIAQMFQEALLFKASRSLDMTFEAETRLTHVSGLSGDTDGLLTLKRGGVETKYVYEHKFSEGKIKKSQPSLQLGYVLQTIAYMMMSGADEGIVQVSSKWSWTNNLYFITPLDERATQFEVRDVWGVLVIPEYENWNNPETLSVAEVLRRVEVLHHYVALVKERGDEPIAPPLSLPDSRVKFMCFRVVKDGLQPKKDGTVSRTPLCIAECPFSGRCQGAKRDPFYLEHHPETNTYSLPDFSALTLLPSAALSDLEEIF